MMKESFNVVVHDSFIENIIDVEVDVGTSYLQSDDSETEKGTKSNDEDIGTEVHNSQPNKGSSIRIQKNHPKDLIIGNLDQGITSRSREVISNSCFVSNFKLKMLKKPLLMNSGTMLCMKNWVSLKGMRYGT